MGSFEDVYRRHVQAVYRFALSVTGKKETAEDLTSEAFLALYRNFGRIDEAQLPGWLLTVVRNRARDLWRRQAVEQRYAAQLLVPPDAQPRAAERWGSSRVPS
jgi:RNA polymerase sigma factor (sigma-70 family)